MEKGYDGKKSDIWSCGVILYVMLAGHFPFSADSIQELFKKIKNGEYNAFPEHFSPNAKDLIKRMLIVNPEYRITVDTIMKHPWFVEGMENETASEQDMDKIGDSLTEEQIEKSVTSCENESKSRESPSPVQPQQQAYTLNAFDLASRMMTGYFNPLVSGGFINNGTPRNKQDSNQVSIRRETRFIARGDKQTVLEKIKSVLAQNLQVKVSTSHLEKLTDNAQHSESDSNFSDLKCFATVKQIGVTFSVKIEPTSGGFCLVEFRRGKGSIIDFNTLYRHILTSLSELIMSQNTNIATTPTTPSD